MAKRYESFCKGITFSARPVKINERVCVKFSELSNNWSGVIRFGFTYNDPATLRNTLPKYACPDLTNKPGYWAKALNERFCERDNILFYYVTAAGDVHFGVNGEEKGVFMTGVETRAPLWTIIDVYGNCTSIEFLDSRICMHHQSQQHHSNGRRSERTAEPEVERVMSSFQSMAITEETASPIIHTRPGSLAVSQNESNGLVPIPFHRTKGRNVMFSSDRLIATRADTEFCQGYVFTARPIRIGEKIIVQILRTEHMYVGALALGLTSCDPATLQPADLPDDSDMLLDRPEYWVVSKDVAASPVRGDEIIFCVTQNGEVQISKNRGPPTVVMHVDQSLQLWAFLDVYGSTQSVRILSRPSSPPTSCSASIQQLPTSPRRLQVNLPSSESINSFHSQMSAHPIEMHSRITQLPPSSTSRLISVPNNSDMIQIQPGGTVLVVNLPPASSHSSLNCAEQQTQVTTLPTTARVTPTTPCNGSTTILSNYSNAYIEVSRNIIKFVLIYILNFFTFFNYSQYQYNNNNKHHNHSHQHHNLNHKIIMQ